MSVTSGVFIYLGIENKGNKMIAIAKAGSKFDNCFSSEGTSNQIILYCNAPTLDKYPQKARETKLNFTFLSESTCILRLVEKDIQCTDELKSNTKIQLENFIVLNRQFKMVKLGPLCRWKYADLFSRDPRTQLAW